MTKGRRASDRRREKEGEDPFPASDEAAPGDVTVRAPLHADSVTPQDKEPGLATGRLDLELSEKTTPDGASEWNEKTEVKERTSIPLPRGGQLQHLHSAESWPITTTPAVLGRAPIADLIFESIPQISREHLKFTLMEDQPTWLIEDLGSTSGTLLNGELLELPSLIKHGDHLIVGTAEFRFMWHDQEPVPKILAAGLTMTTEGIVESTKMTHAILSPSIASSNLKAFLVFLLVAMTGVGLTVFFSWPQPEENPHILAQVEQLLKDTQVHMNEMRF